MNKKSETEIPIDAHQRLGQQVTLHMVDVHIKPKDEALRKFAGVVVVPVVVARSEKGQILLGVLSENEAEHPTGNSLPFHSIQDTRVTQHILDQLKKSTDKHHSGSNG